MRIIHEYLKFIFSHIFLVIPFSWLFYIFPLKNLPGKEKHSEMYAQSLYIFINKIRYSWILWKIFLNRNIICQITILANKNNIHEMKLWQIGIRIYSWPKYQRIDLWRIYSGTIHELFANRELFAEHWYSRTFYRSSLYMGDFTQGGEWPYQIGVFSFYGRFFFSVILLWKLLKTFYITW